LLPHQFENFIHMFFRTRQISINTLNTRFFDAIVGYNSTEVFSKSFSVRFFYSASIIIKPIIFMPKPTSYRIIRYTTIDIRGGVMLSILEYIIPINSFNFLLLFKLFFVYIK